MTAKRNIFSPSEFRAIHNSDFFYVKASATKKMDALLAKARDEIKFFIEEEKIIFPKKVDSKTGKIFRGENYLGLPYLLLDYPKYFGNDSVFAFRTMFWWGQYFSCALHLSPIPKEINFKKLLRKEVYICVNNTPWQYHYEKDNYVLIDTLSERKIKSILMKNNFIKLSRKLKLKEYLKLPEFAKETFAILFSSILNQAELPQDRNSV